MDREGQQPKGLGRGPGALLNPGIWRLPARAVPSNATYIEWLLYFTTLFMCVLPACMSGHPRGSRKRTLDSLNSWYRWL